MTLLILAGGQGRRYGGIKQFAAVGPNDEYLMEFNIFDAIHVGFSRIVIVTAADLVHDTSEYLNQRLPKRIDFRVVAQSIDDVPKKNLAIGQREKPWGTAHAVWSARHEIEGSFALINADDFYSRNSIKQAIDGMRSEPYGLVAFQLSNTLSENGSVSRGICLEENGSLKSVKERIRIELSDDKIIDKHTREHFSGNELVSMNLWMLNSSIFPAIERMLNEFLSDKENVESKELFLPDVIQKQIDRGVQVDVLQTDEHWMGLTYREDREEVCSKLSQFTDQGVYPSPLWK